MMRYMTELIHMTAHLANNFWLASYYRRLGMLTVMLKTKTFTVLTNKRAFLVLRNVEKNVKTIGKTTASVI